MGIKISLNENFEEVDPVELLKFAKDHTHNFEINEFANKLFGIDIKSHLENEESLPGWSDEVDTFKENSKSYLLY